MLLAGLVIAVAAGLAGERLEGLEFARLKPIKGVLASLAAALLLLRHLEVSWALDRKTYRALLMLLAAEAASYAALLLTDRDRSLFAIRSTLVGALLTAQYWSGRQSRTARRHSGAYSEE